MDGVEPTLLPYDEGTHTERALYPPPASGAKRDPRSMSERAKVQMRNVRGGFRRASESFGRLGNKLSQRFEVAATRLDRGGKRVKARLMRSAFLSGLAIDSGRVAKRVPHPRRAHGPRSAHCYARAGPRLPARSRLWYPWGSILDRNGFDARSRTLL